jgi:acetylornithine deacetylase/succinyl-diaminopimelate desuccinylase-like protein
MSANKLAESIAHTWTSSITPALQDYIRIPALSPLFDPDWESTGALDRAMELLEQWARDNAPEGMTLETIKLPGRTPVIFAEIPGKGEGTAFLYGHFDKQPEMSGWDDDKGPWEPVIENGRLYGRGGADDGYALFASIEAVRALQREGMDHPRVVLLIEGSEESGSVDLPAYLETLSDRIGKCDLVIALDSTCGDYERMWCTTSLRGALVGELNVSMLTEGVHSGDASGVVASTFRVVRQLLDRIEDPHEGRILPEWLFAEIPGERVEQAAAAAEVLGHMGAKFPLLPGVQALSDDAVELVLNRSWRPTLSVVGADGLPPMQSAGNVLRPMTGVKISIRLPPTVNAADANDKLKDLLESDPPFGAHVHFEPRVPGQGWHMAPTQPWFDEALNEASQEFFGHPAVMMGSGGSIPFMADLQKSQPDAHFLVTGVLGPQSNAHGPNEFLELKTGERLTACVAWVLARMASQGAAV